MKRDLTSITVILEKDREVLKNLEEKKTLIHRMEIYNYFISNIRIFLFFNMKFSRIVKA